MGILSYMQYVDLLPTLSHFFLKRRSEAECLFSFNLGTDTPRGASVDAIYIYQILNF